MSKLRKDLLPAREVYGGTHRRLRELGRAYLAERRRHVGVSGLNPKGCPSQAYRWISTLVPTGTRGKMSSASHSFMRMQPWEA